MGKIIDGTASLAEYPSLKVEKRMSFKVFTEDRHSLFHCQQAMAIHCAMHYQPVAFNCKTEDEKMFIVMFVSPLVALMKNQPACSQQKVSPLVINMPLTKKQD